MIKINDKDLDVISDLMNERGFDLTSDILMVHFLLMNSNNGFNNEEELVDYLTEMGGLPINKISDLLQS